MDGSSLVGRLIVATPRIGDPNFERTVVLLLAHGEEGAFGVVVNRPAATSVAELVPAWAVAAAEPTFMFLGGPVARSAVVALCVCDEPGRPPGLPAGLLQPVQGRTWTVDLELSDQAAALAHRGRVRLFAGSAGWGPSQLESELAEQAWWVVDATDGDVIDPEPATLWRRVLRRQSGTTSWFAQFPADVDQN